MLHAVKRVAPSLAVLLLAVAARADERPTLHEYVPDLGADEGSLLLSSGDSEPEAIVYQGEVLPAPEGGALQNDEAPMRARPGDGERTEEPGRRSPNFRPDRVTQLEGRVGYYTVFTPLIAPFKRVTAYDAVSVASDGTPVLGIAPGPREQVPVLGAGAEPEGGRDYDRFWGSVVLDFGEGRTVPLPSVAPEARILTLRTEPRATLRIDKDGADNFYATAVGETARQVRVVFLTDAPRDYFGSALPDAAVDALARRVRPLPPSVQRDAETFAAELGLSRASSFAQALERLVDHFRSFEESATPPHDSGNIYLDLARGMRGICRHRVYAFVITAQALGMHARFVHNEAHAWAEVERPGGGWLRVDLGGAATGLDAHGTENRPPYTPRVVDPLPRPEAYERAYRQAAAAARGRSADRGAGTTSAPDGDPDGQAALEAPPAAAPVSGGAGAPLDLQLDRRSFEVFRGRELEVTGVARGGGGEGVSGLRIETLLRAPRGGAERLLGVTVTGEGGAFRGVFGVPPDLPVGDYRLVVRTPGNGEFGPARAH